MSDEPFEVPLPPHWPDYVKSGFITMLGVVRRALIQVIAGFDNGGHDARLAARLILLETEIALLKREMQLKDARFERMPAAERGRYLATERLAILELRAARGWTTVETARHMLVTHATIASWFARRDEGGDDALVRAPTPVNRLPEMVAEVVQRLRASFPFLGTQRIADLATRLGLSVGEATVRRILKRPADPPPKPATSTRRSGFAPSGKGVTARYPNHVWHTDLTFVSVWEGLWVPWRFFSDLQCWPFGWWVGGVIDQHSRFVLVARAWRWLPSAAQVVEMIGAAKAVAGTAPRHFISDRGVQFQSEYRQWCADNGVKTRHGAVHRHGSIAIIERFWRSMKDECFRRMPVPLGVVAFTAELSAYLVWYNEHRPHQGIGGLTPRERLQYGPTRPRLRFETRARMPLPRDGPAIARVERVSWLELVIEEKLGSAELPVVHLRCAA